MNRQVAVYRRLTALYPPSFRTEYREDLTTTFALQLADDGALRCWLRTVLDLIVTVPTPQIFLADADHELTVKKSLSRSFSAQVAATINTGEH